MTNTLTEDELGALRRAAEAATTYRNRALALVKVARNWRAHWRVEQAGDTAIEVAAVMAHEEKERADRAEAAVAAERAAHQATRAALSAALEGPQMMMSVGPGGTRRDEWYVLGWADARTKAIELVRAALDSPSVDGQLTTVLRGMLSRAEADIERIKDERDAAREALARVEAERDAARTDVDGLRGLLSAQVKANVSLAAEAVRLQEELRVSGAWKLREYLDAATQREINLHERLEHEAREYTRLVEHATNRADALAVQVADVREAAQAVVASVSGGDKSILWDDEKWEWIGNMSREMAVALRQLRAALSALPPGMVATAGSDPITRDWTGPEEDAAWKDL